MDDMFSGPSEADMEILKKKKEDQEAAEKAKARGLW